ncbi:MAG: hypothetical protein HY831_03230 [Candidatus Aenigmarchaeota archaeon]|nr:hypothetical protein [Candidatus Aenigmarchaeota archaeon]
MGFFSRLFGKKGPDHVHVEEEHISLEAYPNNKLVKFSTNDKTWPNKLAVVLSREESTEKQLTEVYKSPVPFFYKLAVEQGEKFLQLKLPVSHLRLLAVTPEELQSFKQSHSSIKLIEETTVSGTTELTSNQEIEKWNNLLNKDHTCEHDHEDHE